MGNELSDNFEIPRREENQTMNNRNRLKVSFDFTSFDSVSTEVSKSVGPEDGGDDPQSPIESEESRMEEGLLYERPQFVRPSRDIAPEDVRIAINELAPKRVNICQLLRDNSFVAHDENDVNSLILTGETVDKIGVFPHIVDEEVLSAFDELFTFAADNDYQIITLEHRNDATSSIYVIRPIFA